MVRLSKFKVEFLHPADGCLLLALFLVLLCSPANGQAPLLTIEPVPLGGSAHANFSPFPGIAADSPTTGLQFKYETQDHEYAVVVDPGKIESVPRFAAFTFLVLVSRQGVPNPQWYQYEVRADLDGKFPDTLANVPFKISAHSKESIVYAKLPIHCESFEDAIGLADPSLSDRSLMEVKLSDPAGPSITVNNSLATLAVRVTEVEVRPLECAGCWKGQLKKPTDVVIPPSSTAQIPLNLPPNSLSAMFKSAFVLKRDSPQDTLLTLVTYSVDPGGSAKTKPIQIRIRFNPSLWQLILAVLIGAAVGIILRRILDSSTKKLTPRWVLTSIALAGAAEFFAVVAASYDSKLILLNFDLDPRQFVPTVFLAVVVTGGQPVVKWLMTLPGLGHPTDDGGGGQGRGGQGSGPQAGAGAAARMEDGK
jgi:hypothetical protein